MRIITRIDLIVVTVALVLLAGISVAACEPMVQPEVLNHDEIEFRSPLPMPHSIPFPKDIRLDIDTTPALAGLLRPAISNITSEDIGFRVTLTDEVSYYANGAGTPIVPSITKVFKLPRGYDLKSVNVNLSDSIEIHNIFIEPAQPPVPGTYKGSAEYTIDEETYSSSNLYPGKEYKYKVSDHITWKRAVVHIYPIQYLPSENKVIAFRNATISISTIPPPSKPSALASRQLGAGEEYECVIITHPDFVDECEDLADWKTTTGISTNVVDTTWINNNFVGFDGIENDLPAKIKQFVYQSYLNGTKYVILAGDVDKVPTRYAYVNDSQQINDSWATSIDGEYVPCDLYYVDLCDWDANGDKNEAELKCKGGR